MRIKEEIKYKKEYVICVLSLKCLKNEFSNRFSQLITQGEGFEIC